MTEITIGKMYYIVLPLTDDGFFDDPAINRTLGLPEDMIGGDNWWISLLDLKRVTVLETGLLTNGYEPAVLVQVGKVKWDRDVEVTLTTEQVAELGAVDFSPDATYRMLGMVYSVDEDGDFEGRLEIPRQDTREIPEAWLSSKHPGRAAALNAAR